MAREQNFLHRLAEVGRSGAKARQEATTAEDAEALREAVRQNLVRLLNARHGMSQAAPDYGLPAMVDLITGSGEHLAIMQRAIRTTVEKYEPRLRSVRVSIVQEEDASMQPLVFRVDAVLVGRQSEYRVGYVTAVGKDGQFEVDD